VNTGGFAGISGFGARLERRFLGARFIPEYIDAFYGVDRYDEGADRGKESALAGKHSSDGWYGEVSGMVLQTIEIVGGFSRLQGRPGSGVLHVGIRSGPIRQRWELSGSLDKGAIERLGDLSRRDRTLVELCVGYRISAWSLLYVRFRRTFERQDDGYRLVDVFVPRASLSVAF
jgi:hypothetical protein